MKDQKYLYILFAVVGYVFLKSGFEKIEGGKFVGGLAGTLEKFASKNPYPFFKNFLETVAIPNSTLFGVMTMWGEFLAGLALVLGSLYLIFSKGSNKLVYWGLLVSFLGAMLLNGTFYFAAGWTSPSTESLNLVMFFVGLVGFLFTLKKLTSVND